MATVHLATATLDYDAHGPDESVFPVVVFVHGALMDEQLWQSTAVHMAERGVRSVSPTLPLGAHRHPVPEQDLSGTGLSYLLIDFLETLGLSSVVLVGSDTGGAVCQIVAALRPDLVQSMLLTNCDGFDQFPPFPFSVAFTLLRPVPVLRVAAVALRSNLLRAGVFALLSNGSHADLTRSWMAPMQQSPAIRSDLSRFLAAIRSTDLTAFTPQLQAFAGQVLLVWGMDDISFTPELGRRIAQLFPAGEFVPAPKSRTLVALDAPEILDQQLLRLVKPAQSQRTR